MNCDQECEAILIRGGLPFNLSFCYFSQIVGYIHDSDAPITLSHQPDLLETYVQPPVWGVVGCTVVLRKNAS